MSYLLVIENQQAAIESLRQQLADHIKREVMLRDALDRLICMDVAYQRGPVVVAAVELAVEALAATADLSGVILCHAEPIAHMYQHDETGRTTFVAMPDRMSERRWYEIPLYRAWEPS